MFCPKIPVYENPRSLLAKLGVLLLNYCITVMCRIIIRRFGLTPLCMCRIKNMIQY